MRKLLGGTHFLHLRRCFKAGKVEYRVSLESRFDDVLAKWESSSRVSPIFSIDRASALSLSDRRKRWIVFCGPVFPGAVPRSLKGEFFVSLGAYNLVFLCDSRSIRDRVVEFTGALGVPFEEWCLRGERIVETKVTPCRNPAEIPAQLRKSLETTQDALEPASREYLTLVMTAVGRAQRAFPSFPDLCEDFVRFDRTFRAALKKTDSVVDQGLVVTANAAISRFSSQAYSGTSPILESECHYWTHSLLGIGVASMALVRVRQFMECRLDQARIFDRLEMLRAVDGPNPTLVQLARNDPYWRRDHLFDHPGQGELETSPRDLDDLLPLITCFSGRDGFRSTQVSLSAPLELVSSCNTVSWTPLTITHEISHRVIEGVLGTLLPHPDDDNQIEEVLDLFGADRLKLFDDLRTFLVFALWRSCDQDGDADRYELEAEKLRELIRAHHSQVNEVMTHVFDFLYFYAGDDKSYIQSIWASWGVIPNIQDRIAHYILRSLCALYSNHLRRADGQKHVCRTFDRLLKDLETEYPKNKYVREARSQLRKSKSHFLDQLDRHRELVQVVRHFLYSPRIEKLLRSETVARSRKDAVAGNVFADDRVSNPLSFMDSQAGDKSRHLVRSVWILHQLAFSEAE